MFRTHQLIPRSVISNALASYVYELVQRAYRVEVQVPQGWWRLWKNPEILPECVKVTSTMTVLRP